MSSRLGFSSSRILTASMSMLCARPTTNLVPVAGATCSAGAFAELFAAVILADGRTTACWAEAPTDTRVVSAATNDIQLALDALQMAMPWTPNQRVANSRTDLP